VQVKMLMVHRITVFYITIGKSIALTDLAKGHCYVSMKYINIIAHNIVPILVYESH